METSLIHSIAFGAILGIVISIAGTKVNKEPIKFVCLLVILRIAHELLYGN